MSYVINLWFPFIFRFVRSLAEFTELITLLYLLSVMYFFQYCNICFDSLYDGAFMLLIMGRNGTSGLCNFNCALSVGVEGCFWSRYFIFCLSVIKLHCCIVFCRSFWYLSVGFLGSARKYLPLEMYVLFLEYSSQVISTIVSIYQLVRLLHFLLQFCGLVFY